MPLIVRSQPLPRRLNRIGRSISKPPIFSVSALQSPNPRPPDSRSICLPFSNHQTPKSSRPPHPHDQTLPRPPDRTEPPPNPAPSSSPPRRTSAQPMLRFPPPHATSTIKMRYFNSKYLHKTMFHVEHRLRCCSSPFTRSWRCPATTRPDNPCSTWNIRLPNHRNTPILTPTTARRAGQNPPKVQ